MFIKKIENMVPLFKNQFNINSNTTKESKDINYINNTISNKISNSIIHKHRYHIYIKKIKHNVKKYLEKILKWI